MSRHHNNGHQRNNGPSIVRPGTLTINTGYQMGPLADPVVVTVPTGGALQTVVTGGETILQRATLAVFAALAPIVGDAAFDEGAGRETLVRWSVDTAALLLQAAREADPILPSAPQPTPNDSGDETPTIQEG